MSAWFLRTRGRDQTDGVAARFLEGGHHLALTAGLVRDDYGTQLCKLFGFGRVGVQREACHAVDLLLELVVGEQQFSDQEAGLAVDGCDANFA